MPQKTTKTQPLASVSPIKAMKIVKMHTKLTSKLLKNDFGVVGLSIWYLVIALIFFIQLGKRIN
jgi:hypothetical protein